MTVDGEHPLAVKPPDVVCPIVGIGASAGGLDAFKRFFGAMPADGGVAFVLIPHLDPTHESLMVELLAKHTRMPVAEAADGSRVEANRVYVIPPNKYLAIANGVLVLSKLPQPRGLQTAIDFFLCSLATDQRERAIGIVLSGTGSHGTRGIREIKLAGGMVMAQDPESAEYDQMPRSAIATGLVDYIRRPEDMPDALVKYVQQPYVKRVADAVSSPEEAPEQLTRILALLRARTKYDFRCYRKPMLMRRVQRRMGLCHLDELTEYVEHLREHPDEITALYKDLLIGVTGFFREPEAFGLLEQRVIPELVEHADDAGEDEPAVRVWVPGCATGEEAYSIGMLLIERLAVVKKSAGIQIFATDLDEDSLAVGRTGIYPESIAADLSPERLQRFFTKTDDHHYQVNKRLRETVLLAPQNLISDAPFSKLHLISCRNLLIYLEPDVQKKVLSLFHFALNAGGYLLLGPSESIGDATDMFDAVSKKSRLFRRIGPIRHEMLEIPIVASAGRRLQKVPAEPLRRPPMGYGELMQKVLLADFAPASVLISRKYEVLCFVGPTVDYLEFPPGEPTRDLLSLVRQGLRTRIRSTCQKALSENQTVTERDARVKRNGDYVPCTITVRPIREPKEAEGLLLVTFQDRAGQPGPPVAPRPEGEGALDRAEEATLVQQLEYELTSTRTDLQSTIEELEGSNEELKASNEEIMSMNEELQSTNEELETSKEELQSLNEELSTVNHQLQDKVNELDEANSDITNLLNSSDIATVFLDADLNLRRFTPPTARLFNLIATDIGRPFRDFAPKFTDTTLLDDCRVVLDKLAPVEKGIRTDDDRSYLRRILPYRTADNRIAGVLITFVDISALKQAEAHSRLLATVLHDSNDAVLVHDFDGRITAWNHGAERMYGYGEAEALELNVRAIMPEDQRDRPLDYAERAARGGDIESFETRRLTRDGRVLDVWLSATRVTDEAGQPAGVATTERDVTERKRRQAELETLSQELEQRVAERTMSLQAREREFRALADNVPALFSYVDTGERYRYVNRRYTELFEMPASVIIGKTVKELLGDDVYKVVRPYVRRVLAGETVRFERELELPGAKRNVDVTYVPDCAEPGVARGFFALVNDVTEQRRREVALRESEDRLRAVVETAAEAIITISGDGIIRSFNPAAERIFRFAAAEAIGQKVDMLIPSPYREEHDRYLRRYRRTRVPRMIGTTRELTGQRKDGSTFPIELSISNVDHLDLFTGLIRDVSERKRGEEREREHAIELAHVLRVATAGELASGLAHELNQPLTAIATNIQACVSRIQAGENAGRDLLRVLKQTAEEALRAGAIVHSIRDIVQKRPSHYARSDLRLPIRRASTLLRGEMERHDIHMQLKGIEKPVVVKADAIQIEQVLINLMQNAIDAIGEAGGKTRQLVITLSRTGKGMVEVAVRDTGTGVAKAVTGRLFDPFFSTKEHGLGVGLALSRTIIEAHGGQLWLEPHRGRGATFRFTLPVYSGKRSHDAGAKSAPPDREVADG